MYVVIDMGGTNMRIARSRDMEPFDEPLILNTPKTYSDGLISLVESVKKVAGSEKIEAIAAGVPFVLSRDKRSVLNATNLPGWKDHDLVGDVESALDTRLYLENDTAMVGLGEATFGAGKDSQIVVYITVSTGVNGVRIVDRAIEKSVCGFEIGYQYIYLENEPRKWSSFISGRVISEKYGKHPKDLGKDWDGWEELARITAFGVHNTILHWSPDRVVLGGSMFNEIGIPVDRVAAHVKEIMKIFPQVPEIVHSSLGNVGGLWGGLARLKQMS